MVKIELEITEELNEKIENAAKECLVTPAHFMVCKMSEIFRPKAPSAWLPALPGILRNLAGTIEGLAAKQSEKVE